MSKWMLFITAACLQACAVNPPASSYTALSADGVRNLSGKNLRIKAAPTPEFMQITAGDQGTMTVGIMFGPIGALIGTAAVISNAKRRGQALVATDAIPDPTPIMAERLKTLLVSRYGDSIGESGYELEVATDHWALAKDGAVAFHASIRLTDGRAQNPAVLAAGKCRYNRAHDAVGLSMEQLLDDHAERLKQELATALDHCVQEFDHNVFVHAAG